MFETAYPIFEEKLLKEVLDYNFQKWASGRTGWMFGYRIHPITGKPQFHNGNDLGAVVGTPIRCPWDGVVKRCWSDVNHPDPEKRNINGLALQITHPDDETHPVDQTAYAHLSAWGDKIVPGFTGAVRKGQIIAYVGNTGRSTGAHLHFITRVLQKGVLKEVDPLPFLAASVGIAEIPVHDVG